MQRDLNELRQLGTVSYPLTSALLPLGIMDDAVMMVERMPESRKLVWISVDCVCCGLCERKRVWLHGTLFCDSMQVCDSAC